MSGERKEGDTSLTFAVEEGKREEKGGKKKDLLPSTHIETGYPTQRDVSSNQIRKAWRKKNHPPSKEKRG